MRSSSGQVADQPAGGWRGESRKGAQFSDVRISAWEAFELLPVGPVGAGAASTSPVLTRLAEAVVETGDSRQPRRRVETLCEPKHPCY